MLNVPRAGTAFLIPFIASIILSGDVAGSGFWLVAGQPTRQPPSIKKSVF